MPRLCWSDECWHTVGAVSEVHSTPTASLFICQNSFLKKVSESFRKTFPMVVTNLNQKHRRWQSLLWWAHEAGVLLDSFPALPPSELSDTLVQLRPLHLSHYEMYYWYNCTPKISQTVHYTNWIPAFMEAKERHVSRLCPVCTPSDPGFKFLVSSKLCLRLTKGSCRSSESNDRVQCPFRLSLGLCSFSSL